MKRKGLDEFVYVFIIAVILLLVLSLVTGFYQAGPATGGLDFNVIREITDIGSVGFETEFASNTYSLGSFTVGQTQSESLKTIPQVRASASLINSEQQTFKIDVPKYLQGSVRDVKISFDILDSATYGNLKINWNGRTFYYDKPERGDDVSFIIDAEFVGDSNTLEIMAEGPGVIFWSTTIYVMRNFQADVEYGPSKVFGFEMASSELGSFRKGVVEFSGSGDELVVKVNAVSIYDKTPSGRETLEFDFSAVPLLTGMNILAFQSPGGSVNVRDARLSIYLLGNEIVKTRKFNITQAEFNAIKQGQGRIDYTIDAINREGNLKIRLNNNLLSVPAPSLGNNTVRFTSEQIKTGENQIELSGTGSFEVSGVSIGWEK